MQATKIVIPAAGLGTRFLPITKAIPKEMLPILEKPAIHYIVQEALCAGFKDICFIISKNKHVIADYFDYSQSLDFYLEKKDKRNLLIELDFLIKQLQFNYIRQSEPMGLGHAIALAEHSINDDYFGIALPDDVIFSSIPVLQQLKIVAEQFRCSVIAVQEVAHAETPSYGVIQVKERLTESLFDVQDLIEKPKRNPPSNLAIVGRYFLSTDIFNYLRHVQRDASGEIQLTQALRDFVKQGNRLLALKFDGIRYDLGTPYGWLQANTYCQQQNVTL